MKKLGAFLAITSLLTLVPAAFAADGGVPASRPGESRLMGSTTSNTPHRENRSMTSNTPRSEDQAWHAGDLRPSGLYMGPDGVLHNVPKTQDPRLRIY
jgi:hypothetical protein